MKFGWAQILERVSRACVKGHGLTWGFLYCSDVLHPNRPNVSKNDLRSKLADLYKAEKNQVSVFGFRTQFGGGKSTGFALIYDSHDDLKKFEPHYRKVRYGDATKIEKASRQQRMSPPSLFSSSSFASPGLVCRWLMLVVDYRQATQEQGQGGTGYARKEGQKGQEINGCDFETKQIFTKVGMGL